MRLDRLWIEEYKNLREITIDFDEDEWISVLIGWNGTGKSNVVESLAVIFRDLIFTSKKEKAKFRPCFSYRLYYECGGKSICVHGDAAKRGAASIVIRQQDTAKAKWQFDESDLDLGKNIRLSAMSKDGCDLVPQFVFGYYSGESDRLSQVFEKYIENYDGRLRSGDDPGLKRLFYAQPVHSNYVLLAFILLQDEELVQDFLVKELGLDPSSGIESVLFVMQQPPWKSTKGDHRFWYAHGVVKDFLGRLYDSSLAPIRISRKDRSTMWNQPTREYLYLYLKDLDTLRELAKEQEPREFFRDLESTHVSELIDEIRIRVRLKKNDGSVTFRELSEGEQQLLTVLGLIKFTKERESLFLLDEPDTHLNPRWAVDYLSYLKKFVGTNSDGTGHSHIVLTTHNPLSIAELEKKQVRILKRDDALKVSAHEPEEDPRGSGYANIITSDMFGLGTSLDQSTNDDLLELHQLSIKKGDLSELERDRLVTLRERIKGLDFNFASRDRLEQEYLRARFDLSNDNAIDGAIVTPENKAKALQALVKSLIDSLEG